MGAFTKRSAIRIAEAEGWEQGEYIDIKGVVTAADMEEMSVQEVKQGKDGKPQQASSVSMVAALEAMIEDWLLYGDNQQPVPLYLDSRRKQKNHAAIAALPMEYMAPVMAAIGELLQKAQVQQPEDFTPAANGHSAATLHAVK